MKKLALLIVLVFTLSFSVVLADELLTTTSLENVVLTAPEENADEAAVVDGADVTSSENAEGTPNAAPENDVTTTDITENENAENPGNNVDVISDDSQESKTASDNSLLGATIAIVIVIAVVVVVAFIQKK